MLIEDGVLQHSRRRLAGIPQDHARRHPGHDQRAARGAARPARARGAGRAPARRDRREDLLVERGLRALAARPAPCGGHAPARAAAEEAHLPRGANEFPGEDGFRFAHLLIRDAAYRSIPKGLRAELHERFADWLLGKMGERELELEEIVGYHLEQAYRTARSWGRSTTAGASSPPARGACSGTPAGAPLPATTCPQR